MVVDVHLNPAAETTTTTMIRKKAPKKSQQRLRDSMLAPEATATRTASFAASSSHQVHYDYHSWVATTFLIRARAPSTFVWPWMLCVVVTIAWVTVTRTFTFLQGPLYDLREFERVMTLISTALGFLLVFRLTRAAVRYWDCRAAWGAISMRGERSEWSNNNLSFLIRIS